MSEYKYFMELSGLSEKCFAIKLGFSNNKYYLSVLWIGKFVLWMLIRLLFSLMKAVLKFGASLYPYQGVSAIQKVWYFYKASAWPVLSTIISSDPSKELDI